MTKDGRICFSLLKPVLQRPTCLQPLRVATNSRYQQIYRSRASRQRIGNACLIAMNSGDSIAAPHLEKPAGHILPQGAFTVFLKVKISDGLSLHDQKAILSEYGRKTCAEEGILRCDVLYEVTSTNRPKNKFYELWITFADARAYTDHERSSHAAKLRLCLENPTGGDNSVMLTKLAYDVVLLRPVRPDIPSWRSAFDYSNVGNKETENHPVGLQRAATIGKADAGSTSAVRKSLSMLISSVGLENVKILIATATAKCPTSAHKLRTVSEEYLANLERSAGVIRTGLLLDKNDPYKITLMTVHDASDDDGACFDMELGIEFLTDEEWELRRCFAVFPDKGGWELRVSPGDFASFAENEVIMLDPHKKSVPTHDAARMKNLSVTNDNEPLGSSALSTAAESQPEPQSQKMRLLQGPGAFDSLKQYVREVTRRPTGQIRAMIVYGWNASRIHDLIVQLEFDQGKDPGVIEYTTDFNVRSMDVTTERLLEGLAEVRRFQPDIIIGYGGGSVMDMVKAIAHLCAADERDVSYVAELIDGAADQEKDNLSIMKTSLSLPVMLIPTTIGSGAELTEACIFSGRKRDGSWCRIPVLFTEEPETVISYTKKTVLIDSRLVGPKRLDGFHASQGALQLVCLGIDVLISAQNSLDQQYASFALEGIRLSFRGVIPALREPYKATGQSREALVNAKTAIGLAREGVGRMGVCLRITLAVIDSLLDGRYPTMFRMVLLRVTVAVLDQLCEIQDGCEGRDELFCLLCKVMQVGDKRDVIEQMLSRAEDCNVALLKDLGMVRRRIPSVAEYVARSFTGPEWSASERLFADSMLVKRVLESAMNQEYEL